MFLRLLDLADRPTLGALSALTALAMCVSASLSVSGQCLSEAESRRIASSFSSGESRNLNETFQKELVGFRQSFARPPSGDGPTATSDPKTVTPTPTPTPAKDINPAVIEERLCGFFKTYGFPSLSTVGEEGMASAFFLFKNSSFQFQLRLVPIIVAATATQEVRKNTDYASFIDRLRIRAGLKQLFGTQAYARDEILYIAPIEASSKIDERRAEYNMTPLAEYMKALERSYQMPVIMARPAADAPAAAQAAAPNKDMQVLAGSDDVIRVDTELVNLNVRVTNKATSKVELGLEAKDFRLFEDNKEQEVSFFARTETPFDLVLLLDLSGSTADKQSLIRKAAKRFIEAARPTDRISVVVFTDRVRIVTPLTADRKELLKGVDKIQDMGGSYVWDALEFTLRNAFPDKSPERRRAVVMMSDGVDNALTWSPLRGSKVSFGQLLENVRESDVMIVPIYLETQIVNRADYDRTYRLARKTLTFLAEESGGQFYKAAKIEHLNGVYETVLSDLSGVYSIGYSPSNDSARPGWRNVRVELRDKPDLSVRTKPGYYRR